MAAYIKVESPNLQKARKGLSLLEKAQFPFAYALALTRMAKRGQELAREQTRNHFQLHGDFIPNNIRIKGAQKSDIQRGFGYSEVYTTEKIAFMTLHEEGGTKVPLFHKMLALPTLAMKMAAGFYTATGKIAKKYKPSQLLKKFNQLRNGTTPWNKGKKYKRFKSRHREPQAFIAKGNLVVRTGEKRYPLQTLYGFEKQAQIKPLWNLEPTVRNAVHKEFDGIFRQSLKDAML